MLAQLAALVVGVTWATGRVKTTTEVLLVQIKHLSDTIAALTGIVSLLQSDHHTVRERLSVLEQQTRDCPALYEHLRRGTE